MRVDHLLRDAMHTAITNAGGKSLLDAGLASVISGAIRTAGIPADDLTPDQYRAKLGIEDHHAEMAQSAFGLFRHLGLYKPPAAHPEIPKRKQEVKTGAAQHEDRQEARQEVNG